MVALVCQVGSCVCIGLWVGGFCVEEDTDEVETVFQESR